MGWTLDYLQAVVDDIYVKHQDGSILTLTSSYPTRRTLLKLMELQNRATYLDPDGEVQLIGSRECPDTVIYLKSRDAVYEVAQPSITWKRL